ncbi:MAG: ATP-NAD kinase family protein [Gammaproteobacteria bacterium]|nr:ATP-NAD kinase family protein [Gammaproteobacteria bacterium]
MLRLGLIVNPLAGLGGPSALKGSDGAEIVAEARRRGAEDRAGERAGRCLAALHARRDRISIFTWDGAMGADVARAAGFEPVVLGAARAAVSDSWDTRAAVKALAETGVDLLLFAGGDGTARDVCSALPGPLPVLGIPAGVKMHSGVYAVTPEAAANVVCQLQDGALVGLVTGEVRDIDEAELRAGRVNSRWFGDLLVPAEPRWVQHTKIGGRESEPLVLEEIAADIAERMAAGPADDLWVIGPGSTTAAVMAHLGLPNTLLGVDLIRPGELLAADLDAKGLLEGTAGSQPWILITFIGGQGHLLGRGNQQLTPELLRRAGRDRLVVIATRTKRAALAGRPLIVDSGDPELDQELAGYIAVTTGYEDQVLYPVG